MRSNTQRGVSAVEILLVLVFLGLAGLLGYTAYNAFQNQNDGIADTNTIQTSDSSSEVPTIKSTADLDTAAKVLDQTETDDATNRDLETLDSQLATF